MDFSATFKVQLWVEKSIFLWGLFYFFVLWENDFMHTFLKSVFGKKTILWYTSFSYCCSCMLPIVQKIRSYLYVTKLWLVLFIDQLMQLITQELLVLVLRSLYFLHCDRDVCEKKKQLRARKITSKWNKALYILFAGQASFIDWPRFSVIFGLHFRHEATWDYAVFTFELNLGTFVQCLYRLK